MATAQPYEFINRLNRAIFVNMVTSILQFNVDNYSEYTEGMPRDAEDATAYIVACMFAQRFDDGVEAGEVVEELKPSQPMTYGQRLLLVNSWYAEFKSGTR